MIVYHSPLTKQTSVLRNLEHDQVSFSGSVGRGSPVMWSETVGLRTRLVWDQKSVLQIWCCVVKHGLLRSSS